jgi:hypothetical protein
MIRRSRSYVVRIVGTSLVGGVVVALGLGIVLGTLLHATQPYIEFEFGRSTGSLGYRIIATAASLAPLAIVAVALAASTQVLTEALGRASRRSARSLARALGRPVRRRSRLHRLPSHEELRQDEPPPGRPAE